MNDSTKQILKAAAISLLIIFICFLLLGCREADKVNHNLAKQADYFNCERKITVYNARTDRIIFEAEGYMSLGNTSTGELIVTFKTGEYEYKKNYVYLNEYTLYVVEDISGTHTDPYHYHWEWHMTPQFEVDVVR